MVNFWMDYWSHHERNFEKILMRQISQKFLKNLFTIENFETVLYKNFLQNYWKFFIIFGKFWDNFEKNIQNIFQTFNENFEQTKFPVLFLLRHNDNFWRNFFVLMYFVNVCCMEPRVRYAILPYNLKASLKKFSIHFLEIF